MERKNSQLDELSQLSAKVTALTMLVETLWVTELARDDNPAAVAKVITDHLFDTDKKVQSRVGESDYSLMISDAVSSLIDRATGRALRLKGRRPK